MNAYTKFHSVVFKTPFYTQVAGTQLHQYLVPEFMQRFERELANDELTAPQARAWMDKDRFSKHDNKLVLRQPVHKTFYVVSCELVCDRLGLPALDDEKVTSAGFVIRRQAPNGEQSWMLQDDEPLGWQPTSTGARDPDAHRRLCRDGTLHPRPNIPTFTGEQTHPLRPKTAYDQDGKRHTVLFGYLPVGGSSLFRDTKALDDEALNSLKGEAKKALRWPYGYKFGHKNRFNVNDARPVKEGKPTKAFFELLRLLTNRYHLGEPGVDDNEGLKELAQSLSFYTHDDLMVASFSDATREDFKHRERYSFYAWLSSMYDDDENPLVAWMARQEKTIEAAGGISESFDFEPLPAKNGQGDLTLSMYNTPSDAREFRTLLEQRVVLNANNLAKEIPVPKFQQSADDVYQIVPFVRVEEEDGKERLFWAEPAQRSEVFRVAAPYDADASRTSVIQMPSLSDVRKGLAKGASMITPPDTFNLMNALNLKKGASEDVLPEGEPSGIGIQWICSFSLPVISLVAMILLMIMISLLNIIFFWLPWVKICLPFPKIK